MKTSPKELSPPMISGEWQSCFAWLPHLAASDHEFRYVQWVWLEKRERKLNLQGKKKFYVYRIKH